MITQLQKDARRTPADFARHAWAVLIVCARHNETISYIELKRRIGYPGTTRSLGQILYRIKHYCEMHGLPRLSALVVYKSGPRRGLPGNGADAQPEIDPHAAWDFDWMKRTPCIPSAAELGSEWFSMGQTENRFAP